MKDPISRAEKAKREYRNHLIGGLGEPARNVYHRFGSTGTDETFSTSKGPYLQALEIPNWSDTEWEDFCGEAGIHPQIRSAFSSLGFERLYDFQERTIETVKQGENTLVTAATGRGKTEAWLIPVLDYALRAREGNIEGCDPESVKAMLIYPTKALAQDQLKRLLDYLYKINRELPKRRRITVGIYDGDTPTNMGDSGAEGYLRSMFKYFDCPGYNEDLEKCRNCGKGIRVEHGSSRFELKPEKPKCEDDVPLEFMHLTKQDILQNDVDIVLTNPDTINMKAVNMNAPDEQRTFIHEPDFLIFDEVHTYTGLFGSYTSMLVRRLRRLRESRGNDDLQVIASSATVGNHKELFRKISGADEIEHVDEDPERADSTPPSEVPESLVEAEVDEEDLVLMGREEGYTPEFLSEDFVLEDHESYSKNEVSESVSDRLFEYFTDESGGFDDSARTIRYLCGRLTDSPMTKPELVDEIQDEFGLRRDSAESLLENFRKIGVFSGLLENRNHLFSWPVDGFYSCPGCDAVYRSPRKDCVECDSEFVTRSTYCNHCGEESLVAWFCPVCEQMDPYMPTEDGGGGGFSDEHTCQRCSASRDEDVECMRVTFRPYLRCQECGAEEKREVSPNCPDCGSEAARTDVDRFRCKNPVCDRVFEPGSEWVCGDCGCGDRTRVVCGGYVDCPHCGDTHDVSDGETSVSCGCGREIPNTRLLPWVCNTDDCERLYFDEKPPSSCSCGSSRTFARAGLFEVFDNLRCGNCDTEVVYGAECGCDEPDLVESTKDRTSYKVYRPDGEIDTPTKFRTGVPCYHSGTSYSVSGSRRRYDELRRSPNNLAVTTSQQILRDVSSEKGYSGAKMLSFSDSRSDMNELGRDFDDPEINTALDQLIFHAVAEGSEGEGSDWVEMGDVVDDIGVAIDRLEEELFNVNDVPDAGESVWSRLKGDRYERDEEAVRKRVWRRTIPHTYSPRYREREPPLVRDGVLNARLSEDVSLETGDEKALVEVLVSEGNRVSTEKLSEEGVGNVRSTVDSLEERDVVSQSRRDGDIYVGFSGEAVELAVPGTGREVMYSPEGDETYSVLDSEFGNAPRDAEEVEDSPEEIRDISHPRYSYRARLVTDSSPRLLWSQVYLGSTPKKKRRDIEYLFKEGNYPHFLSSGPTMEVGVDIGSLDSLLLFGTPPNMNAYLQRIGRAGRRSKSALIHSVSKRNPIDYYYYEEPTDLIEADPKDVPLNEHNEEVLRVSLCWAIFDYIASNFSVNWEVEHQGRKTRVEGGDNFVKEVSGQYAKLTHVMYLKYNTLGMEIEASKLEVLKTLLGDHRDGVERYLKEFLDYHFCVSCGMRYPTDVDGCGECGGEIRSATQEYGHLVQESIDDFADVFVNHPRERIEELKSRLRKFTNRETDLNIKKGEIIDMEEQERVDDELDKIRRRKEVVNNRINDVRNKKYLDFLADSKYGKYAFGMRDISNNVTTELLGDNYESESLSSGRGMKMAMKEFHPGAAYLHDGDETYIVTEADYDDYESERVAELLESEDSPVPAEDYVCLGCGSSKTDRGDCDSCGGDAPVKRRRVAVLDSVEARVEDIQLSVNNDRKAGEVNGDTNTRVQSTYSDRESTVLDFEAGRTYRLLVDGEEVGTMEYGDIDVLLHSTGYRAKYENGDIDVEEKLFERCGVDNCSGIIVRGGGDGGGWCTQDLDHDLDGFDSPSELVRLGHHYKTEGVRLSLGDEVLSHTFSHGLRMSLQYLGGVEIRDVEESVEEDAVYVFDSQEGGANVTKTLLGGEDMGYFREALEVIEEHYDCDCESGCPMCVYQYGCDVFNDPDSLDRDVLPDDLSEAMSVEEC